MLVKMKALRDFRGRPGEGNMRGDPRLVEAGPEFNVASQKRADDLERAGLAVPIFVQKKAPALSNKMEPSAENKAAAEGPLASPGGEIGAANAPLSSPPVRQPRRRD